MKLSPEQDKLITELANDCKPVVESIEKGIKTTQNNYGRYMAVLSRLSGGDKKTAQIRKGTKLEFTAE